jgi:hypothetical protein
VLRILARNVAILVGLGGALLAVFQWSGHSVAVLPADASPGPVLVSALCMAAALTALEQRLRPWSKRR